MIVLLLVISDELRDQMTMSRGAILVVGAALLVVLVMGSVLLTVNNIWEAEKKFRADCIKLGGSAHRLGDETICLVKDRVMGRRG